MSILGFLDSLFDLNNTQDKKDNPIQNPAPTSRNPQPKPSQGPLNNPPKDDFFNIFESIFSLCTESRKDKKPEKKPNTSPEPIQQPSPEPIQPAKSGYQTNLVRFSLDNESARNLKNLISQFLESSDTLDGIRRSADEIEFLKSISQNLATENSNDYKITVIGSELDLAISSFEKLSTYSNITKDGQTTTDDHILYCLNYLEIESRNQRKIDKTPNHR